MVLEMEAHNILRNGVFLKQNQESHIEFNKLANVDFTYNKLAPLSFITDHIEDL